MYTSAPAAAAAAAAAALQQNCPHLPRCSVGASDDTWLIEMKYAFLGPTALRCCSC